MGLLPKLSDHNQHQEEINLRPAKGDPYVLRDTDYRIVHEGGRRTVAISIIVAVVVLAVVMIAGMTVDSINHVPTDPLERVCLPIITALIGVLGGFYASGARA
jgi:hypothetical protein